MARAPHSAGKYRKYSIVSAKEWVSRRQHLVHRRARCEELVEHAEASGVLRRPAVIHHEVRDVHLSVAILTLAPTTRAAATRSVHKSHWAMGLSRAPWCSREHALFSVLGGRNGLVTNQ